MSNYNGQFQDANANGLLPTPHSYANIEGENASQAYSIGQMVVYNNRLCEVISDIAQGDEFEIGTNVAYKTVGEIGQQLVTNEGVTFYFDFQDNRYGYNTSPSRGAETFSPFGGNHVITVRSTGGRAWHWNPSTDRYEEADCTRLYVDVDGVNKYSSGQTFGTARYSFNTGDLD